VSENLTAWLADLEVGDEVAIKRWQLGRFIFERGTVERILPTQIIARRIRFKRDDGTVIGSANRSFPDRPRLVPMTDAIRDGARVAEALDVVCAMDRAAWRSLSTEALEEIAAIIERAKGGQP
jgi:hypothetical protein